MREILFRGKRKDNGKCVYGFYIQRDYIFIDEPDKTLRRHYILPLNEQGAVVVLPETVGQYTGIKDKKGKRIFEGDILFDPSWWWGPRFVYFTQGKCGPCNGENVMQYILAKNVDNPERNAAWNLWDGCEVEVIGNIHDNPELLKGE